MTRPGATTRRRRIVQWGCVGAVLLTSLAVADKPVSAVGEVRFGSRVAARGNQTPNQAVTAMETAIGRPYDDIRIFKLWNDQWPDSHANWLASTNHTVMLSVKSARTNGQRILWSDVANAQPGSALYNDMVGWANKVKNFDGQVYFTFNHEPEASASSQMGNATQFKAAWIKFITILREQNVTNAKMMWIMTDHSFRVGSNDSRQAIKWYPGDAYVDGIASDSYNWYLCRGQNELWRSLEAIVLPMRDFGAQHPTKELWLTEFASAEDPANPARKPQWLRDARALFKKPGWEQFAGVLYFNYPGQQQCNWFVDSSAASLAAYREMAQDPFYGGPGSPPPPPPGDSVLYVVSSSASPTAADDAIRDRLVAAGYAVTLVSDAAVTAASTTGYDAVLISATVSTTLGSRLRSIETPVVMWKPWLYDDMGLTGATANVNYGNVSTASATIVAAGHPLAAGLTGTTSIYTAARTIAFGDPAAAATVVATVGGSDGLFVYQDGAALFSGPAATGCRIGFPAGAATSTAFTANGWALFEAAVDYASAGCAG